MSTPRKFGGGVSQVSNKFTLQNEGFLSKLASTLGSRVAPPNVELTTTLKWHKTSEVKERVKTATGTVALYEDTPEEEVQRVKEYAACILPLGEEEIVPDVASTIIAEAASIAAKGLIDAPSKADAIYVALDYYTPDDTDGLPLIAGQKLVLIDSSSPFKKLRLDYSEDTTELLDNSAAKHKMAIRPKKHHPDPRARGHDVQDTNEEMWLVRDFETGKEGRVPAKLIEPAPAGAAFATSLKRSLQEMSPEQTKEVKRKLTKEIKEMKSSKIKKSSSKVLGPTPDDEARAKRAATIRELIETEEEFVKDLDFVMTNYYSKFDDTATPKHIADQKEAIFSNFKYIAEFHKNVLIEGVRYNADVPKLIGKTFLRLERDFDNHSAYCCNEPLADQFIENNPDIKEYFEDFSQQIGDDKRLQEHLKLPIQRLNDYQLLLKELVKYSSRLGDDTTELEKSHELMQTIPQRATDAKFIASIEGFKGNLFKLGRLIRHDWFTVTEAGHKPRERYLFLFKARILVTKVKRIGDDRSIFILKDIIRLPETSLRGLDRPKVLELLHIEPQNHPNYPVVLEARNQDTREAWLSVVQEHVVDTASVEDLLFDDEIRVVSEEGEEEYRGLKTPAQEPEDFYEELPIDKPEETDQVVPETSDEVVLKEETLTKLPEEVVPKDITEEQVLPVAPEYTPVHPEEESVVDFWEGKEASPPPKRRKSEAQEVAASTEIVKETLAETEPITLSLKRGKEKEEEEVEFDFWADERSSPPLKKRTPYYIEAPEAELITPAAAEVTQQKTVSVSHTSTEVFTPEEEPETPATAEAYHYRAELEAPAAAEIPIPKEELPPFAEPKESLTQEFITTAAAEVTQPKEELLVETDVTDTRKVKDSELEQVETTAVKAEKKVAEPKEEITQILSEDTKQEIPVEDTKVQDSTKKEKGTKKKEILKETEVKPVTKETKKESIVEISKSPEPAPPIEPSQSKAKDSRTTELPEEESIKAADLSQETELLKQRQKSTEPHTELRSKKPETPLQTVDAKKPEPESEAPKDTEAKKAEIQKTSKEKEPSEVKEQKVRKEETSQEPKSKKFKTRREQEERKKEATTEAEEVKAPETVTNKDLPPEKKTEKPKVDTDKKEQIAAIKKEKLESTKEKKLSEKERVDRGEDKEGKHIQVRLLPRVSPDKDSATAGQDSTTITMAKSPQTPGPRPVFTKSLVGEVIEPGEAATFVCEVTHPESYYVIWLKDNKALDDKLADRIKQTDDGTRHTLKLLHCRTDDSGVYTAKATDSTGSSATCSAQLLVHQLTPEEREKQLKAKKPFFLVKMMNTEVIENTNLSYAVHVKGDPMPTVLFFKGKETLLEDDRVKIHRDIEHGKYELLITHVQKSDADKYRCVAKNKHDSTECEAEMFVTEEKEALERLTGKGSLMQPGEKADFKWYRDGVEFDPAERFNVMFRDEEDTLALVFQNVTPEDAGIYTCVASTSCGKISCSAELTVEGSINRLMKEPAPPKFESGLMDTHATITGTALLECRISGYPKPELKWYHAGEELEIGARVKELWEDAQGAGLIIKNVDDADKGLYKVVAKNDLGEASSSCKLIIKFPPKFRDVPKIVGCSVGENLTYQIEVDGEPLPEIKWLLNDKELHQDDRIKFEKTPDGKFTLKIKGLREEECGPYTIVACNDMGQRTDDFEVRKNVPPEITKGLDAETEKVHKTDHVFEVKANGSPAPTATWFKDGKELCDDDKYTISVEDKCYKLKVKGLTRLDKGTFKIVLKNTTGTAESAGQLIVRAPPFITEPLEDACAKEGSKDIHMPVVWDSHPKPNVKWMYKDKVLREDSPGYNIKITDTGSSLIIQKAVEEVVGYYSVTVSNEYGEDSCKARFRLHEAPSIIEALKDVEFLEDTQCVFACKVYGIPIPKIEWKKNGQNWFPDEERVVSKKDGEEIYMLVFEKAKTGDSAKYVATISNVEGQIQTEGSIIVNTPPHIIGSNFRDGITFIAMHKFVLEVEATAVPEAEASWFWNGKPLKEEEDSVKFSFDGKFYRMERIGSDPDQSGEYKCKLTNKIKSNEEVGIVTIIEKESRVRQPLQDVAVKEYTDGKIQCQIVGDPIPEVQWFRNGKPLTSSGKIEISADRESRMHFLIFRNVEEEDKSTFTVKGKNEHGICETSCLMTIHVAPRPGEFQNTVVDWGSDLLLQVHIHAIPVPDVIWYHNEKKLEESDRISYLRDEEHEVYSLKVKSAVLPDDGTYSFKATNAAGEASRKADVKVHTEVPTIVEQLVNVEKCLEDEVTFYLRCAGLPLPEVEWRNKSEVVNNADGYSTGRPEEDLHTLTLKDIQMQDYGTIKGIARNLVGEAVSTAEMTQKKLGCEVLEGLENFTTGAETDDVVLSVKIRGSPRPKIVWTKDGDVLSESGKYHIAFEKTNYCEGIISLTIWDGVAADSGQYRLKFYNDVNEAQTETALIVRPMKCKPKISKPPGDLHVLEKESGMFKARITGFPKPTVRWLKDGREIKQTDVIGTGVTADKCYYIDFKHITMEDAGKYTVVAGNSEGVTQYEVYLTVDPCPAKPEFLQGLKPTKVIVGYPCRMEVQLGGHPTPQVNWMKDGKPITIDGQHIKEIVTDDGRVILQIDFATEEDQGEYSVLASNDNGQSASSAVLSVLGHERTDGQPDGPAEFKEGLRDSCFDEGKTIKLPVTVKGGPVPDMKWYKDGTEIWLDDRCFFTYDGDTTYLEIYPCLGSDAGKYKCVIENEQGTAETECDVTIRKCFEKPSFTYGFPNQQQLPGGDAKFSIKVDGVPRPEILWYFNGIPIIPDGEKYRLRKDADGYTLLVKGVTEADTGSYKCVAKNREGEVEHQANLLVSEDIDPDMKFEPPVILKAIGDQELYEEYTARFKALVTGRPTPEFEWLRNGLKVFPNNRIITERDAEGIIRMTIKHVTEEDAGVYELRVWNDYGKASCKGNLICECLSTHLKRPVGDEYQGFDKLRSSGVTIPLPDKPIISALSDRRVTLSWLPYLPSGPVPPVTYQVEMCKSSQGDWFTAKSGIRGCCVDIDHLETKPDYKFRVRVENKFGVSEPSPYVATYRHKLERDPICCEPLFEGDIEIPLDRPFVPPGFQINVDDYGNFSSAPRFLKLSSDTQYGMKNFNTKIKWIAYGYPTPKVKFYYKDNEIHFGPGSKYSYMQEATGELTLFVDRFDENDVGWYKCEVHNEYGESQQRIRLALCEYPKVIRHLQETYIRGQTAGKIFCRISAFPPCDVKWYKNWEEIKPSMKLRPQFLEPDMYCLNFNGPSYKDSGLYSISAVNVAGAVSSSCMVNVEEDEWMFNWSGYGRGKHIDINVKRGTLRDHYDIGDELGRGTQGITYHCVEHHTGRNFAAKCMRGADQFKVWMHMEYEMMNQVNACKRIIRLHDVYEGPKNMVLVTELCSGGDLLSYLTKRSHITEFEVAYYIRQVLEGLDYMHDRFIAHLGLNIGDIMVSHVNGRFIKVGDLSLARNIRQYKLQPLDYGMPEFVAPEVAKGENVTYPADMWAVGVITYLLLSGTSPFRGEHDRETLTRIQKGELRFDAESFANLSEEAKDFVAKLLQFSPENRMDVKSALHHPWMKFGDMSPRDPFRINTDRLRSYQIKFKEWYANASCRNWYRRRPLESAFTHPSKMVYPPGEIYTPEGTPERDLVPVEDYTIPYRDLSYDLEPFRSDSRYQKGPDTFLLQLRDPDFPSRLRHYMNIARERSPSYATHYMDNSYDYEVGGEDAETRRSRVRTEFKPSQFVVPAQDSDWNRLALAIPYSCRAYALDQAEKIHRQVLEKENSRQAQTFSTYAAKETYESAYSTKSKWESEK